MSKSITAIFVVLLALISSLLVSLHISIQKGFEEERNFRNEIRISLKNDISNSNLYDNERVVVRVSDVKLINKNLHEEKNQIVIVSEEEPKPLAYNLIRSSIMSEFNLTKDKADNFTSWIIKAHKLYGKNLHIVDIMAVVGVESSYRYSAESSSGAIGPMQVKPKFWDTSCPQLNDPESNIICGTMILSLYKEKYCGGDEACAFKTYNVGPTNYKDISYIPAKNRYYQKVMDMKQKFSDNSGINQLAMN